MSIVRVLVTNNPQLQAYCTSVQKISGTSWDVFLEARNRVHQGWKLLTHPLYGNFLPSQQPYRSLLLQSPEGPGKTAEVDADSFSFIEEALGVFRSYENKGTLRKLGSHTPEIEADYAVLDLRLLQQSLEQYGLWREAPFTESFSPV
ncbi:MAG TPA: GrdX family protein [Synergistaceae bacterium]|nr:GrdX family protein [Synergistaceae bacterium]HPJ26385.1 GrdX family protein [Synergistaceae bacterium]HPQ38037.1 GrdX family protein [Synergistaceae bacterium]